MAPAPRSRDLFRRVEVLGFYETRRGAVIDPMVIVRLLDTSVKIGIPQYRTAYAKVGSQHYLNLGPP